MPGWVPPGPRRQGFFDENMFAGLQRALSGGEMRRGRSGDDDRVHRGIGQYRIGRFDRLGSWEIGANERAPVGAGVHGIFDVTVREGGEISQ